MILFVKYMEIMNMKNTFLGGAMLSAVFLSISSAWSAPSIELKVTGAFTTPSCNLVNGNSGTVELGKISVTGIKQTSDTELAAVPIVFTVTCDSATFLSFKTVDNRAGTASTANDRNFGLGAVNGSGKLGYYTVELMQTRVDGSSTGTFTTKGSTFTSMPTNYLQPGARTGWSKGDNDQVGGKTFAGTLLIKPYLASEKAMNGPITDQAKLDGSATLAFSYGI
ncbi:DUF1120 domain-containing protein [Serratia marcescens]|uniref:DUF1120 domain-containing protein n=1 Tax=Serratia marcescens TaxID=615 RepID=UPI001582061A|nr:DUF1120 domain-containing protein [Serratia marcescens]QKO38448.1 DUF1120 domain-containing protein [Serratia marcescens]